jgi:hypothetical protein
MIFDFFLRSKEYGIPFSSPESSKHMAIGKRSFGDTAIPGMLLAGLRELLLTLGALAAEVATVDERAAALRFTVDKGLPALIRPAIETATDAKSMVNVGLLNTVLRSSRNRSRFNGLFRGQTVLY